MIFASEAELAEMHLTLSTGRVGQEILTFLVNILSYFSYRKSSASDLFTSMRMLTNASYFLRKEDAADQCS